MSNVQPKSPEHEGVDPLTKGDTMYPREDTKAESEKLAGKRNDEIAEENQDDGDEVEQTVTDQEHLTDERGGRRGFFGRR